MSVSLGPKRLFFVIMLLAFVAVFSSCGGDDPTDGDNNDGDITVDGDTDGDSEDLVDGDQMVDYPAGPYGTDLGDTIANLSFTDCDGNEVALSDFYGDAKAILINQSAGWCTVCRSEMDTLKAWYGELKTGKIVLIQALNQNNSGDPADEAFCKSWKEIYDVGFPLLIDAEDKLSDYEPEDTMPLNIVLNSEMVIQYVITGGVPEDIKTRLTNLASK